MYTTHRRAPGHLVLTQRGQHDVLAAALALAERLHDPAVKGVTITVEQDGDPRPLASLSTRPIIGKFTKQVWTGRKGDDAVFADSEMFDATAYITALPFDQLVTLRDFDDTSDTVGTAHVNWDGPHEVEIVDSICDYFGVSKIEHITASHYAYVTQMLQVFSEAQRVQADPKSLSAAANGVTSHNSQNKVAQFLAAIARMNLPSETSGADGKTADPDDAQLALSRLILQSRELIADRACVGPDESPSAPR